MKKEEYEIMYKVEEDHFWYRGMRRITETLLKKYLPKKSKNKILDAGCGTGGSLLFLKNYGIAQGVDISDLALSLCHKRGLKNIKHASVNNLPFKDGSFDVITSFDVLCHKNVNDKEAMVEFYRVLKPGGILIVRLPAYQWLYSYHDVSVHNKHRYTSKELNSLMSNINFQILKMSYVNFFLFPLVLLKRILARFSNQNQTQSDVVPIAEIVDRLFYLFLFLESILIRYVNFPFGLSVMAVAVKKR